MNLWVRKSGLIILSALTLLGCEEELSTVGLPPENNLGIFFVDVPLKDHVSQVWVNGVNTRATGTILVGSYEDEYFGHLEARNFSELTLPSSDPGANLSENIEFDSLVLEARIRGIYGSNPTASPQAIEIYQLADTIPIHNTRYTTASSQALGQKLSQSQFMLYPDSLSYEFADSGRDEDMDHADSTYREKFFDDEDQYIYKSTFKIADAFAQDFFDKMKNSDPAFDSLAAFAGYMKGIAFVPAAGNSAIITYGAADTRLVLYYTETADDGTETTETLNFKVATGLSYNNISPNENQGWTASDFDALTSFYEPYKTAGDLAYVQSGTNLLLNIDLSIFNEFSDTVENAVIQNAELVFNNIKSVSETTSPPAQIAYYVTSADSLANENYHISHFNYNRSPIIGNYDADNNQIRNDITLSLQSLIEEETYNQIIVTPVFLNSNNIPIINASGVNRLVVNKDDISVRFYYTIPDRNK